MLRENVPAWQYEIYMIAQAFAYQMERELSLIELALDGYRHSSAPDLEDVIRAKEAEAERVRGIIEGLKR